MSDTKIQWHPGFISAMDLELRENRTDLVYEREYNLNTKPLEIDLLVIKKDKNVQMINEIGKLFRGHNIMEYKSPEDGLNIDTFYKSGAYASLYKSYGETVDKRTADDITVSIVRQSRPAGLFGYFEKHGIRVTNPFHGIYYVLDAVLFPTQIVVTRELDKKEHTWLTAISEGMEKQDMKALLERIDTLTQKIDRELADSVLEVSIRANRKMVEELRGDGNMCQALLEIMEPEIMKIKEEVRQETRQETILCAVEGFRDLGTGDDKIREILKKKYGFSDEEAEEYL